MTHRRGFIANTAALLATALAPRPLPAARLARIGYLVMARNPGLESAFPRGLSELGYREGREVTILWQSAEGHEERMPRLASELVRSRVDIIVAAGPEALNAARNATKKIPIVVVGGNDPVAEGWAATLARPGGNVTGLTVSYPELVAKRLELLGELIPRLSGVAWLLDPTAVPAAVRAAQESALEVAARSMNVDIGTIEVRRADDFDAALRRALVERRQAIIVAETAMFVAHRREVAALAIRDRLAAIGQFPTSADAGYLATYGVDVGDLLRRAAGYVDKIIKGASPGALPVERPTKFEFVVNLATARILGLTLSHSVLLRADRVIH